MKAKNWIILSSCVVTIVAIVFGLCFFFLGNKAIKRTPSTLSVQKIDQEISLVAEYDKNYSYLFKLEQKMDDDFYIVDLVRSDENSIKLSEQNIQLLSGETYRFSVCYTTENQQGKFGEAVVYTGELDDVTDFKKVENALKWNEVRGAEGYQLDFVDSVGTLTSQKTSLPTFDLTDMTKGEYVVYLKAYKGEIFSKAISLSFEIV